MLTQNELKELQENYKNVADALHQLIKCESFKKLPNDGIEKELIFRQYDRTKDKASILKSILNNK